MSSRPFDWLSELLARLEDEHILVHKGTAQTLLPARLLELDAEDWGRAAQQAHQMGLRWSAGWAEEDTAQEETVLLVYACLALRGDYLVVRTAVDAKRPVLPSHTPHFPAADRPERHIQDMLGLAFLDHPDNRRWTRHQAWTEAQYPLRKAFPQSGNNLTTPADDGYPFLQARGAAVYEIPVGPVHAGIIEPGHFRFQAVGETILNLEERLGYVHKGIEKIAEGRTSGSLARLAGRVSGDSTVAHAWAACQAMERAAELTVPPRGSWLRAVMLERERIANHLGDIGAICNDVGFAFAFYQFGRLREDWQRDSAQAFGHRLMMDQIIPGGVRQDLDAAQISLLIGRLGALRREVTALLPLLEQNPSLEDRLEATGVLRPEIARWLGALGYVGRASGCDRDVRRDTPYPPYDRLTVEVPMMSAGDVDARVQVRAREVLTSLDLLERLLADLPQGAFAAPWRSPAPGAQGLGVVEGWRGETLAYVRYAAEDLISRYFPRDPSWLNWPTLERLVRDNIVPDFPVCNKSINGSYSGHDL